jgi:hypothetical protein
MANRIFDKETLLDLTVNVIPLFIILFFVVVFALVNPWGFDPLGSGLQYALLIAPFVALAVLTYLSGKAIAGAEKTGKVYLPGQANVTGARTLHEREADEEAAELAAEGETPQVSGDETAAEETDSTDAEAAETTADPSDEESSTDEPANEETAPGEEATPDTDDGASGDDSTDDAAADETSADDAGADDDTKSE